MQTRHQKTKIVLDADVIIHFMEASSLSLLPAIFPEYDYILLDVVYNELAKNHKTKHLIDNCLRYLPKLKQERFAPQGSIHERIFLAATHIGKG